MELGIRFKPIWNDVDVHQIEISAWNGQFGGIANVYVGRGDLAESASKLEGFPKRQDDLCQLKFGAFGPESAGGGAALKFYCGDRAGHISVEMTLESDSWNSKNPQTATLRARIEPAAIDIFVAELALLETENKEFAILRIEPQ